MTVQTLSPHRLLQLIGVRELRFSLSNDDIYLSDHDGHLVEIDWDELKTEDCYREGRLFSEFAIHTKQGIRRFKWLPKKASRATKQWLMILCRYRENITEIGKAAAKIRKILQKGYLRDSRFQEISSIAARVREKYEFPKSAKSMLDALPDDLQFLYEISGWKKRELKNQRKTYLREMKEKFSDLFDDVGGMPLTQSQRDACVIDQDNNLVLAAAGTGKTSVMIARACFLVRSGQARADEILMLAYAGKARDEMQERLEKHADMSGATVSTFHKLGKDIMVAAEGEQPSVSALAEDEKKLTRHVNQWFEEEMRDRAYKEKVLKYFEDHLYPCDNPFDFKSLGEYFEHIRANKIRTLRGEKVKSLGECLIANHLLRLGIEYEYEQDYEHPTRSPQFRQYKPDFYLPKHRIYLEHVGIDRNGDTASYIDRERYHEGMKWKRELHEEHGTTLIETYHHEMMDRKLEKSLEAKLRERGVEFNRISQEFMLEGLRDFGAISEFAKLLAEFLQHVKSSHLEKKQLMEMGERTGDSGRLCAALELLDPIMRRYEAKLEEEKAIDFDDMIGRAISYVQDETFHPKWRFILVDEFQDISEPRARLLKALRDFSAECSLFCVGDDWQSIYRFTGSDVTFMTDFKRKFGATEITTLDRTFRFNSSICDVSSEFILKNPSQLSKQLSTLSKVDRPAVSLLIAREPKFSNTDKYRKDPRLETVLERIARDAPDGGSVLILSRFNMRLPPAKTLNKQYETLDISTMTIHGAKGKEADFVVLLGLQSGEYGFPSEKVTHPLLEALLPEREEFQNAEERRLLYVALTRARRRAYLICDTAKASKFSLELLERNYDVELDEFETDLQERRFHESTCGDCETGIMVLRQGKNGAFYGCSHFPLCRATEYACPKCTSPWRKISDQFKICVNRECGCLTPVCPLCGGDMKLRHGRYGSFWGCGNYKRYSCTHKVNTQSMEFDRLEEALKLGYTAIRSAELEGMPIDLAGAKSDLEGIRRQAEELLRGEPSRS